MITKNKTPKVRIITFISGNWSGQMGKKKYPMPKDYLSKSELPKPLVELSKKNGWTDERGNVYFNSKWQPEPFIDEEKNITWILANNNTHSGDLLMMSINAFVQHINQKTKGTN